MMNNIHCGDLGLSATCIKPHPEILLPSSATIKISVRVLETIELR
jgi:hypothetical protein